MSAQDVILPILTGMGGSVMTYIAAVTGLINASSAREKARADISDALIQSAAKMAKEAMEQVSAIRADNVVVEEHHTREIQGLRERIRFLESRVSELEVKASRVEELEQQNTWLMTENTRLKRSRTTK